MLCSLAGWRAILRPGLLLGLILGPGQLLRPSIWVNMLLGLCNGLVNIRAYVWVWYPQCPLFSTGKGNLPKQEKENVCDWLGVGNNGLLMLVCSNMRITKEYSIFGVTFDAVVWDSLEA